MRWKDKYEGWETRVVKRFLLLPKILKKRAMSEEDKIYLGEREHRWLEITNILQMYEVDFNGDPIGWKDCCWAD